MSSTGPYLEAALEQAPNGESGSNAVSSNVFWLPAQGIEDDDGLALLEEQDALLGYIARMPHLGAAEYAPTVKLPKVWARPSYLGLLLTAIAGSITTVQGDGSTIKDPENNVIPVGAYRHTITFKQAEPPQTLRLRMASGDGKYRKASGMGVNSLEFGFDGGALSLACELLGLYLADIIDPALTPAIDMVEPFRKGDMTLTWPVGSATTDDFSFKIENPLVAKAGFANASLYPSLLEYDGLPLISGTISRQSLSTGDWSALTGGAKFSAVIKIKHRQTIGATSYYHTLWVVMPGCQYVGADRKAIQNQRRREVDYNWEARYDSATASLATITLVNGTAAYATYA